MPASLERSAPGNAGTTRPLTSTRFVDWEVLARFRYNRFEPELVASPTLTPDPISHSSELAHLSPPSLSFTLHPSSVFVLLPLCCPLLNSAAAMHVVSMVMHALWMITVLSNETRARATKKRKRHEVTFGKCHNSPRRSFRTHEGEWSHRISLIRPLVYP